MASNSWVSGSILSYHKVNEAANTRMTGELGRVSPLENLGVDRVEDKQTVRRPLTWIWLEMLSLFYHGLNLPGDLVVLSVYPRLCTPESASGLMLRDHGR